MTRLYRSLRPYGGVACFDLPVEQRKEVATALARLNLPQARIDDEPHMLALTRAAAQLPPAVSPGAAMPRVNQAPPLDVQQPPPVFPIGISMQ